MKIHLVATEGHPNRLVKAHTRLGAEKFVRESIKPDIIAIVPTQEQLVAALQSGIVIEDATAAPASAAQHTGGTPINQQDQE